MLRRFTNGLRSRIAPAWFDLRCSSVWRLSRVECDPHSRFELVSQLHRPAVTMYLLALQSFARYAKPRRVTIIDDGLTDADRDKLARQVTAIEFLPIAQVDVGSCPVGGCWERLATLSRINQQGYVIQLDSDMLFLREPVEVLAAMRAERSFVWGTKTGRQTTSLDAAAQFAETKRSGHVQHLAEAALNNYPGKAACRYVRGCAAFSGFAHGCFDFAGLQDFSDQMSKLIGGDRWCQWGSEQVASNFMIANCPDVLVLSPDLYVDCTQDFSRNEVNGIHFIGSCRFRDGMYLRGALRVIADLQS